MNIQSFAAIMLSASSARHIGMLRELVACAHQKTGSTPVIIGGPVLEQTDDILRDTQADFATSDVAEALAFVGMPAAEGQAAPAYVSGEVFVR